MISVLKIYKLTLWIHLRCGNVKIFILSSKGTIMILKNIRLRYKCMAWLDIININIIIDIYSIMQRLYSTVVLFEV